MATDVATDSTPPADVQNDTPPTCTTPQLACAGHCVDPNTDPMNCGSCGHSCPAGMVCATGSCAPDCAADQINCGGRCVSAATDNANCGACGTICPAGQVCNAGHCDITCGSPLTTCAADADAGTDAGGAVFCADLNTDAANCGACGNACPIGNRCVAGHCEVTCVAGQTVCSGVCRDLQTSRTNCGACDNVCPAGQVCSSGACAASCGAGLSDCSGACIATATDPQNCGGCGTICNLPNVGTQVCGSGQCLVGACSSGFADCDANPANGCETSVNTTDVNNCGGCGIRCSFANAAATCTAGACTLGACAAGFADCDGNAANGCEVNVLADNANCGACSTAASAHACAAGQVCATGTCGASCGAGTTNCSGDCVQTATDVNHCGACGAACALTNVSVQACAGGACVVGACATGFADCDAMPANGCETNVRAADVNNCGGCNLRCGFANAAASCDAGTCVMGACATGFADCDGNPSNGCEVDTRSDNANCGACSVTGTSHACAAGQVCSAGACAASCGGSTTDCGGSCVNTATDPSNCGACGQACALSGVSVPACTAGACVIGSCTMGFADCNGASADGCEVNTAGNDVNNCGGCNVRCSFPHASASCSSGACMLGACDAGFADCNGNPADGCEVDTTSNNANCGGCSAAGASRACASGQICSAGTCAASCGAGLTACSGTCVSTNTDPSNCGGCGTACALPNVATNTCSSGSCTVGRCAVGRGDCDGNAANGCETAVNGSDVNNCGGCGVRCAFANAGATCVAGSCVIAACNAGFANCDGSAANGCEVNTDIDRAHCGACTGATAVCASGQVCSGGACTASCGAGLTTCSMACFDTTTDPTHCGSCTTVCPSGSNSTAYCAGSTCGLTCASGFGNCDGNPSNGCERSLTTLTDCGACGRACSFANAGAVCSASGVCAMGSCNTGFADCDGNPANGCEVDLRSDRSHCGACTGATVTCAAGQICASGTCAASCGAGLMACSGACTNTQFDPTNCGACGTTCPAPANTTPVCAVGTCSWVCQRNFADCDRSSTNGCERDLSNDASNCGACGNVCTGGLLCAAGVCGFVTTGPNLIPSSTNFDFARSFSGRHVAIDAVTDAVYVAIRRTTDGHLFVARSVDAGRTFTAAVDTGVVVGSSTGVGYSITALPTGGAMVVGPAVVGGARTSDGVTWTTIPALDTSNAGYDGPQMYMTVEARGTTVLVVYTGNSGTVGGAGGPVHIRRSTSGPNGPYTDMLITGTTDYAPMLMEHPTAGHWILGMEAAPVLRDSTDDGVNFVGRGSATPSAGSYTTFASGSTTVYRMHSGSQWARLLESGAFATATVPYISGAFPIYSIAGDGAGNGYNVSLAGSSVQYYRWPAANAAPDAAVTVSTTTYPANTATMVAIEPVPSSNGAVIAYTTPAGVVVTVQTN